MAFTRALVFSFCSAVRCSAGPADGAAGFPAFTQLGSRERSTPLEGETTKSQHLGSEFHFAGPAGRHAAEGSRHSVLAAVREKGCFRARSWMKTNPHPG